GATLNIRNCVVSNFIGSGISIQPTAPSFAGILTLLIENTSSVSNGADGIFIQPVNDGQVRGTISQTTVANNGHDGFEFTQPVSGFALDIIHLYDSLATHNVNAEMEVENCASAFVSQARFTTQPINVSGCTTTELSQLTLFHNSLVAEINMSGNALVSG